MWRWRYYLPKGLHMTINVDDLVRKLDEAANRWTRAWINTSYQPDATEYASRANGLNESLEIVREWAKELSDAGYMMMRPVTAEEEADNVW